MSGALQTTYAPESICWGCGPANPEGLHLESFPDGDEVTAEWTPGPNHAAFPGVLNGGIIGTLLDCHCNWSAAYHFMRERGLDHPPVTVTADYTVRLRRPTDAASPVRLVARVAEATDRKAVVEAELFSGEEVTATCSGTFVAIDGDHPAAQGW
ncbi:MAG: PaaI family thioesterase [Gemmatimonadetes bacterium]|nr:PaaI family thioesterase [Gemmatimonadota bacterium]